jgi:predicted Zn finger-like uncharacterized protein
MIIQCKYCNKKFNISEDLIPENGRQIQCGSCNYSWYYKLNKELPEPPILEKENNQPETILEKTMTNETKYKFADDLDNENFIKKLYVNKKEDEKKKAKSNSMGIFFSYLIIFVISLVALVILLETMRVPLIKFFPRFEFILFNLFETLKDIKLFIIDLI